jgi:hypothetical protein
MLAEGLLKACPFLPHVPHLRAWGLNLGDVSLELHLNRQFVT